MLTKQLINIELMRDKGFDVSSFNWHVLYYPTIESLRDKEPSDIGFVFPSINAAKRFMEDNMQDYWFYEILLYPEKVNCPSPYCNIL